MPAFYGILRVCGTCGILEKIQDGHKMVPCACMYGTAVGAVTGCVCVCLVASATDPYLAAAGSAGGGRIGPTVVSAATHSYHPYRR